MGKLSCIEAVSTTTSILLKEGLLPSANQHKFYPSKLILHFIANALVLGILITNILNGIRTGNATFINQMTCVLIPVVNLDAKSLTVFKNRNCFVSILEDLSSDIFNTHSDKLNEHIQLVNKVSRLMLRYFMITMGVFVTFSCILPMMTNIRLLIPSPIDMGNLRILYEFMHFSCTTYLGINSACFDVLYVSMLGICVAQLNILETRLTNIYEDSNKADLQVLDKILSECIKLHDLINKFVRKLNTLLSFPLFIQYTCGCFIICNAVLQLSIMGEKDSANILTIVVYVSVTFAQIAIYHWLGNEVIFMSSKIIEACYLSQWYNINTKSQKSLLLLMERAKRPLVIEVYKLIFISLESLAVIVRWSYSLFALIRARYS